jgi:hypothetical protein
MLTYRPASRRAAQLALEKTRSGSPDLQSVASRPSESCPVPRGAGGRGGHLLWWVDNLVKQSVPTRRPISFRLFLVPRHPHPVLRQLNRRGVNFPGFLGETMCPVPWDLRFRTLDPAWRNMSGPGLDPSGAGSPRLPGIISLSSEKGSPPPAGIFLIPTARPFARRVR